MDLPKRKPNRLPRFDYSTPGAYFITICTQNRKCTLGHIVGGGDLDAPYVNLSPTGTIVQRNIEASNQIPNIHIEKYVIMPNHIHMIVFVDEAHANGTSWSPSPTNAAVPHSVSTFKRFCHQESPVKTFQRSYHDHVIRGEKDCLKIWQYIDSNPAKWQEDCFYIE